MPPDLTGPREAAAPPEDFSDAAATFGDRLCHAREAMGLSQSELARRMGVKPQTLRNWEEDRAEPRATRLQMLAATLNAPMVWLLSGDGPAPRWAAAPQTRPAAADAAACLRELRRIRAEQTLLAGRMARVEKRLVAALAGNDGSAS
ncbi:helix-turn-helix transcriptional regulator [Amaricoccus sp.]|uniref:helix-turn-helix domain-containing protein n=1 Tax=Amaricoccus sp. TaxID=1872485 RepID=UPI001B45A34A|nr:helix-turn-helix transcriptional regulator [Amaricoccus sp.]MBP7240404.1 helix-turn-helix transcriptional regulator [Amaricoccus sp.]